MSSLFVWLNNSIEVIVGDGNIKSDKQGFVMILLDKILLVIERVIKS